MCTHLSLLLAPPLSVLPPRDGDGDLDGLVRSGVLKSRGWCRVETMIVGFVFRLVFSQSVILDQGGLGESKYIWLLRKVSFGIGVGELNGQ